MSEVALQLYLPHSLLNYSMVIKSNILNKKFSSPTSSVGPISSFFYHIPQFEVYTKILYTQNMVSFRDFINAFCVTFQPIKTKAMFCESLRVLTLLYFVYPIASTTDFTRYLATNSRAFNCPGWVSVLIMRTGLCSRTKNKMVGWTVGESEFLTCPKLNLEQFIKNIENEGFVIFHNTPFSYITSSKYDQDRYLSLLRSDLDKLCSLDGHDLYEWYIMLFSSVSSVISPREDTSKTFTTTTYNTDLLGMYRFRNGSRIGTYITSQNFNTKLHANTAEFYAIVLRLLNPTFINNEGDRLPDVMLPGDMVWDVSSSPYYECFRKLFSYENINPKLKELGLSNADNALTNEESSESGLSIVSSMKEFVFPSPENTWLVVSNYKVSSPLYVIFEGEEISLSYG